MQYFKFFIQSTVYGDTERYQISYRKLFAKTVIYRTTENRCCISKSLHRQRYCEEKDTALEVFRTDRGLRKHREIDAVPEVLRRDCSLQIHRKTDTVLFLSAFFQQSTAVGSSSLDPGIYVTIANADPLFMRSFTVSSRTPPPPGAQSRQPDALPERGSVVFGLWTHNPRRCPLDYWRLVTAVSNVRNRCTSVSDSTVLESYHKAEST